VILVDTSIWVDHLRSGDKRLAALLDGGEVLTHPFVIGELALGNLRQRDAFLPDLLDLPPGDRSLLPRLIDREAVRLTADTRLWTRDRTLNMAAAQLGLAAVLLQ
jgi:predicted nucleic acid-binding protein